MPGQAAGPVHAIHERDGRDRKGADVEVVHQLRPGANRAHGAPRRGGHAEKGQRLHQHDDDADSGHESGDDHMRRVRHEAPYPRKAQQHL